jgi:outer membrane protein assembly factor BamB
VNFVRATFGWPKRLLVLLLIAGATALVQAEDWPQFRGPTGQGHATERGLPLEWSETRNIMWKTPVPGLGWSSPAVANGRVWLTTVVESKERRGRVSASLRALAFDVSTGRELVNVEVFHLDDVGYVNPKNSRASPTPVVDGDRVYVHFGADGTAALSASGEILWTTHLRYESQHGNGGSPTLYRDLLIVNCDGNGGDAYVVALDTATGKPRWKTSRRKPADQAYSTPLVITVGQQDQLVSVGAYRAAAYEPLTGQEIWRVSYGDGFSNVPRPVFGQGLVFIATGFQTPSLIAVRPDGKGDVTRTHVAWTTSRGAPYTPSPLLVGNDLYYVSDTGVLTLADATSGQVVWQQRLGGNYSASPVLADGRIYFQSEEGMTTVIAPGREFRRLAINRLDGATLASMAVSQESVFLRTHTHLYRIAERK